MLQLSDETEFSSLKEIIRVLDEEPVMDKEMIQLLLRVRDSCFCTFYDVLKAALPAGICFDLEQRLCLTDGFDQSDAESLSEQERTVVETLVKPMTAEELEKALSFDSAVAIRGLLEKGIIEKKTAAIRGVGDKTVRIASLAVSIDEAEDYIAKTQKSALPCKDFGVFSIYRKSCREEMNILPVAVELRYEDLRRRGLSC